MTTEDKPLEDMDYDELEALVSDLTQKVMEIDAQLSARRAEGTSYDRDERAAYNEWRGRAVAAKNYAIADLVAAKNLRDLMRRRFRGNMANERDLSRAASAERRDELVAGIDAEGAPELLARILVLLHRALDDRHYQLDDVDRVVMSRAHRRVEDELGQSATAYVVERNVSVLAGQS